MTIPEDKVTIRSLANVAEILPFLLGHYPDDSIAFHCPGPNFVDGPTMTCPLPDDSADWQAAAEAAACQFIHYARSRGRDPQAGVIIWLCREPRPGQTAEETAEILRPLEQWLTDAVTEHRGTILQTLALVANRWWAYSCPLDSCCEGEPLPALDAPDSAAAQLIRLGYSPGRRTSEIVKEFEPISDPEVRHEVRFFFELSVAGFASQCTTESGRDAALNTTHELLETAIERFRKGAVELDPDLATRLICGLHDDWAVDHGIEFAEDDDLPPARRLWSFLARSCVPPFTYEAAPALTLLAFVAWRQNDIITARLALRQALTINPDYEIATGIHLGIEDEDDPREFLIAAREARAERLAGTQPDAHTD
nr:DUF4192 domain-containing protein [Streptomyces sp. NBC_00857]